MLIKQKEQEVHVKLQSKLLGIKSIKRIGNQTTKCITVSNPDGLYITDDRIITHNSPASIIVQFLCSYSLKKSSELLLEPFNAMLEASPYFEKVRTREKMVQAEKEYEHMSTVDRVFYTTASPTSELSFTGGANIKLVSNPQGLLGTSCLGIAFSELTFFKQAGRALYYKELIKMEDGSSKPIIELKPGDKLYPINSEENIVENIMWEGEDELYEIETDDGRTVKCNLNHLWKVKYNGKEEIVNTQFMLDHPEIEFEIPSL